MPVSLHHEFGVVCYIAVITGISPNLPSCEILDDSVENFFFFLPDPVGDQLMH